jgi:hypothetical protein
MRSLFPDLPQKIEWHFGLQVESERNAVNPCVSMCFGALFTFHSILRSEMIERFTTSLQHMLRSNLPPQISFSNLIEHATRAADGDGPPATC